MGGGYEKSDTEGKGGTLTVTARISNGASRYAMPTIPKLVYAALLYPDGNPPENPQSDKFVEGTKADDSDNLIFSFQRPDETEGILFTLEVFAFVKPENETDESTTIFSRESALLSGYEDDLTIEDDSDEIKVTNSIALSSDKPGTVSLKVTVPDDCSLEIKELKADGTPLDDESHFTKTGTSPDFTITQNAEKEISADAYLVKFSVKKAGEIIYMFSEYINVINGLCTDTWDGLTKDAPKVITQNMISNTVYVRGSGDGWYKTSPYNETAVADDDINSGSFLSPLATIQKAVEKIIAINEGTSAYTIYVDGTLDGTTAERVGANGMADFSALTKNLNLTIKALSDKATLDANQKSRVIYAKSSGALNLTLENLVITGGKLASENGAGICFESTGGTLKINGGEISGNVGSDEVRGGGVYVGSGKFIMNEVAVSGNSTGRGAGIYVDTGGTVEMNGGTISNNNAIRAGGGFGGGVYVSADGKFEMTGGTITNNEANRGGGAYVNSGTFTMSGDTISGNTATYGGGVYFNSGTFTMSGGTISGNTATYGGGVYVLTGIFTMSDNSTISNNEATGNGGGVFVNGFVDESTTAIIKAEFEMCGGTISGNTAVQYGGGVYVCSDTKNGVTASGMFTMSDSAKVAEDNDVYLSASGSNITTITIAGALTATNPVATITPSAYAANRQVLSKGNGVTDTMQGFCDKFKLMTDPDGGEWKIAPNGTDAMGVLKTNACYVRGSDATWYESNAPSANASDSNSGVRLKPFATIQKAIDTIIVMNDGTGEYTIYVDGTLDDTTAAYLGASGMADFYALNKKLTLTIKALSGTATLDGGARFDADGNVTNAGIGKRIIYARSASGALNLTLENLVIKGGNSDGSGGGIHFESSGGVLTMSGGTITGNTASVHGGGVYVNSAMFEISGTAKISGNVATGSGGGVFVSGGEFTMCGGTISENKASNGGGVFVYPGAKFTMTGGTISKNEATSNGGGMYVNGNTSLFTMSGGEISGNKASNSGGGICDAGTCTMSVGTISGNTAKYGGGVFVYPDAKFTMTGGTISKNEVTSNGGGVYVNGGTFTMEGGTVSGNTPDDVYPAP